MRWLQETGIPSVVKAGADAVVVIRSVHIVLDVLLAAPHDLDRIFRLRGEQRRLDDEIDLEPAAEAAAEQMIVYPDFFQRHVERLGDERLRPGRHLRSDPNIASVRCDMDRAVDRLHGRVRQERRFVNRFDLGGAPLTNASSASPSFRATAPGCSDAFARAWQRRRPSSVAALGPSSNLTPAASRPCLAAQ